MPIRPSRVHAEGVNFAVIDVETTGLDPDLCRAVEIAIVEIDRAGRRIDQFSSLLRVPGEDALGAEFIHHITRDMIEDAPSFGEVISAISERLEGRIVVGHVVEFDLGHLRAEFHRAGAELPQFAGATLCTRDLARILLPPGPKTLGACCAFLGIDNDAPHTALGDACATADLLIQMLQMSHPIDLEALEARVEGVEWTGYESVAQRAARPRERFDIDR